MTGVDSPLFDEVVALIRAVKPINGRRAFREQWTQSMMGNADIAELRGALTFTFENGEFDPLRHQIEKRWPTRDDFIVQNKFEQRMHVKKPMCGNCGEHPWDHPHGKCPFAPTNYTDTIKWKQP